MLELIIDGLIKGLEKLNSLNKQIFGENYEGEYITPVLWIEIFCIVLFLAFLFGFGLRDILK